MYSLHHQVQSSLTRDGILLITAQREEEEEREQIEEKMKQVLSPASWGGDKGSSHNTDLDLVLSCLVFCLGKFTVFIRSLTW